MTRLLMLTLLACLTLSPAIRSADAEAQGAVAEHTNRARAFEMYAQRLKTMADSLAAQHSLPANLLAGLPGVPDVPNPPSLAGESAPRPAAKSRRTSPRTT